jgi:thiol-disulfide isomerase/thioredoxin
MEYLDEHSDFERLIGRAPEDDGVVAANAPLEPVKKPLDVSGHGSTVVYFTATWCGPCKRLAPKLAEIVAQNPQIKWLKCDVDRNNYTPGFCNVKGIPSFMAIRDTKILGQAQISDGEKVAEWVGQIFQKSS